MTKAILPGMVVINKSTDVIHVVVSINAKEVHAISLDQLDYNQYESAEYVKFAREYFQFVVDHYCD